MELLTVVYTVVALYICAHTGDIQYAVTDELGHVMQQDEAGNTEVSPTKL